MKRRFLLLLVACLIAIGNVFGQASDDPEYLGSFSSQFTATRGVYPPDYADPFTSYYFTLTTPMDVIISHCESTSDAETGIFLSDMNSNIIASDIGGRTYDYCVDGHAYVVAPYLLPGTYRIDIDWPAQTQGSVYTKVQGLHPLITRSAKDIGEFGSSFNYVDTKDTREPYVGYQGDNAYKNSVCYSFYLLCNMDIRISHCGSEIDDTTISLLKENGNIVSGYQDISEAIVCDNPNQDRLGALNLAPGMYYVVSQGTTQKGRITTRITGTKTVQVPPITEFAHTTGVIDYYAPLFVFEDKKETSNPNIGYQGYNDYRNGVCYRFRLWHDMDVEISHCGSLIPDTEVYLLDANGNQLAYNNDYYGVNACDEPRHAYLEMSSLAAGTYYVVSVGESGRKGEISTRIICKDPEQSAASKDKNYILTRSFLDAFGAARLDKIDYFDEMGRKEQTVHVGASPWQEDLATLIEYDAYGRVEKSWLQAQCWTDNGEYISPDRLKAWMRSDNCNDQAPYSLTEYESSPLNRAISEYGPGYDWHSKGKAVRTKYQLTNVIGNDSLNCIHYSIRSESESMGILFSINSSGNHPTGTFDAVWKTDEDGNAVIEFTNRFGQVVLSRQIVKGASRTFYDTYYIYDEWGNLRAVLPPKASDQMKTPNTYWSSDTESCILDYAYLYKYDKRFRLIAKRLPGQSYIRYVYDKSDSPVFVQDAEQRKLGEWSFTITDGLGRVCLTGICRNNFEVSGLPSDAVIKAVRDNQTGIYKGYSISGVVLVDAKVMTVNYYDDYSFMGTNEIPDSTNTNYRYDHVEGYGERYPNGAQSLLTGKLTAKVDGGSGPLNFIPTVMYYDYRGRLIQSKAGNHLPGGIEQEYIAYDFVGNPVKRKHIHSPSGGDIQTEEYTYTYDRAGRLQIAKHSLNGAAFVTLNDNAYDGIGNLISVVCRHGNRDIMETCYGYNVRSWLTHINGSFFNQQLYYNNLRANGTNVPSYSGNISGMDWKATSDNVQRGYDFTYDNLSRLTRADYLEQNIREEHRFDTSYEYDKHGNPLRIKRYGQTGANSYGLIDNLFMTMNGNQLKSVENTNVSPVYNEGTQFKNGTSQSVEYSYDANGALIKDSNKGIEEIRYNFLHLPSRVVFSDGSVVSYVYDADGVKRRTTHIIGNETTVTDYCGNAIYENGVLSKTLTSEGYITLSGSTPTYHYYLKDHLGNNRMVVDQNGTVEQVNHYYPFGGLMSSSANNEVQPYMYNGKELDRKNGLDLYDYSARYMDGVLGRFTTMDPHAENYYAWSPYHYAGNNPLRITDPTGMDWYMNDSGHYFWQEGSEAVDGYINIGSSISIQMGEDLYMNYYQNAGIKANQAVNAFDLISQSGKLQNDLLGKNSVLSQESQSTLYNGLISQSVDAIARPIGEAVVEFGAGALGGAVAGRVISWGIGKIASKIGSKIAASTATANAINSSSNSAVNAAVNTAKSWLGEGARVITNSSGDYVFISKDGLRKIRFDIKAPRGDKPHLHLEEFVNGKWRNAIRGTHRIYPK